MSPSSPLPGRPVRGSSSGQPLSVLLDLIGRRWCITILWVLRDGPRTFGEIKGSDQRMSNGTTSTRLRELRDAGLVNRTTSGTYALSTLGRELIDIGQPLAAWSLRWAATLEEQDPQRDRT